MAFAAAFVFLGKRGAAVGAVGGLVTGGSIGALIVPAPLAVARKPSARTSCHSLSLGPASKTFASSVGRRAIRQKQYLRPRA